MGGLGGVMDDDSYPLSLILVPLIAVILSVVVLFAVVLPQALLARFIVRRLSVEASPAEGSTPSAGVWRVIAKMGEAYEKISRHHLRNCGRHIRSEQLRAFCLSRHSWHRRGGAVT